MTEKEKDRIDKFVFRHYDSPTSHVYMPCDKYLMKTNYVIDGKNIYVGDIIQLSEDTYECNFGMLYKDDKLYYYGVYFIKNEEQNIILDRLDYFDGDKCSYHKNKYNNYTEYYKKSAKEWVLNDILDNQIITYRAIVVFMKNNDIDYTPQNFHLIKKYLKTLPNIKLKYRLRTSRLEEYQYFMRDKKEDIPKKVIHYDLETYEEEYIDSEDYIEEILIKSV